MKNTVAYLFRLLLSSLTLVFLADSSIGQGTVEMEFSDSESSAPISARLSFTKSPRKVPRPKKLLNTGEQWLAERNFQLSLPNGEYEFFVQRGPEFKEIRGGFTIESKAKDIVGVEVPRAVDMHAESWYSGDHLSSLPVNVLKRWQAADALDLAISIAKEAANLEEELQADAEDIGLQLTLKSHRVDWQNGSILIHSDSVLQNNATVQNVETELQTTDLSVSMLDSAQAFQRIAQAKNDGDWVELLSPWQRDVPLLLATDQIRAVQILSEGNRPVSDDRIAFSKTNAGKFLEGKVQSTRGKERFPTPIFAPVPVDDEIRYTNARGLGSMTEFLYWQMLEAGFRIAPTAGSHFGSNDSRLGYNRVYVFAEEPPTPTTWMNSIHQGRTTVTNGPLLRTLVNGQPPGSVQASYRGQPISVDIAVSLTVREPVDYLDVIFNGETIYSAKLEDHYKKGEFPPLEIDKSGWLVVRVITGHDKGYRLATTAPFYFEFDNQPRKTRSAVDFFQSWLTRSVESIEKDDTESTILDPYLEQAKRFWSDQRESCTVD